eukprot:551321_1
MVAITMRCECVGAIFAKVNRVTRGNRTSNIMSKSKISARFLILCVLLLLCVRASLGTESYSRHRNVRNREFQKDIDDAHEMEALGKHYLRAKNFYDALDYFDNAMDKFGSILRKMDDYNLDIGEECQNAIRRIKPKREKARRKLPKRKTTNYDRWDDKRGSKRKRKSALKTVVIIFLTITVIASIAVSIMCYIMCLSDSLECDRNGGRPRFQNRTHHIFVVLLCSCDCFHR